MTITDRLDEIQARAEKATDGPWDGDYGHFGTGIVAGRVRTGPNVIGSMWLPSDGTFTAHARTDVPALVAALRAVLHLHRPTMHQCGCCGTCDECDWEWPCGTVRAVEAALGEVAP